MQSVELTVLSLLFSYCLFTRAAVFGKCWHLVGTINSGDFHFCQMTLARLASSSVDIRLLMMAFGVEEKARAVALVCLAVVFIWVNDHLPVRKREHLCEQSLSKWPSGHEGVAEHDLAHSAAIGEIDSDIDGYLICLCPSLPLFAQQDFLQSLEAHSSQASC